MAGCNFLRLSLLIGLVVAVYAQNAAASTQCTDLPESTLRIFSILPRTVEERLVSTKEMKRIANARHLSELRLGPHLLVIDAELGATVSVKHRFVKMKAGDEVVYCDAPELIDLGIGAIAMTASMERRAASDTCIHQAFTRYEADRRQVLDNAIDDFISQNQGEIANRLRELKETPASDPKAGAAAFEAGLRSLVIPMAQAFMQKAMDAPQTSDVTQRYLNCG